MAKYTSKPFGVKDRDDLSRPDKDQFATTYDILSEGPIEGLSNGLASIFINDVPVIQTQAENILKPRRFKATTTASVATANVNNSTSNTTALAIDGNSGTILQDMVVTGTGISGTVTVATVIDQNNIVLSSAQSLTNNVALTFTPTVTNAQFAEIDALSYQNKTGLSLGIRKVAIEKAGAKGTGIASATINTKTVTTSSAYFNTTMLQHCRQRTVPIYLRIAGAGANGTELRTRITGFTSTTEVTIADVIATTVSNVDIFFDHLCTLTAIDGNVGVISPAPVTAVTNANIQVGSPHIHEGLGLSNLFNFKDVDIGFRVGNKLQPLLSPRDSEGTSTLFAPNLQLEQADLRSAIGTTGNLSSSTYNDDELDEVNEVEGTAADTVLTAAAMGVTAPSEVDDIHLTFQLPQCHALKSSSGAKGPSYVELQIFFEYSTDGGISFTSELAYGATNNDILTRTNPFRPNKKVNHTIGKQSSKIPNNGYIKPAKAQYTSFIEEFKIDTREFQPFDTYRIRVRRITALNFKDQSFQHTNPCTLQTVDNIIKDKLSYPYTSYASLSFNAKDFDSKVPTRSYLLKGRKVKVPTNYFTRDETGGAATYKRNVSSGATESTYQAWDGNFRGDDTVFNESSVNYDEVYTDNPVWIFYDILTNKHYGLGQFIDPELIDKYELFRLARFCDEEVPNGEGGTEPRFTCNVYLTKAQEATTVLKQLASVFRGMAIWADGQLTAISDRPKKPVYTFTKANVKDGIFSYEGTGEKVKVNQVKVTWSDPADSYRQAAEYVEDTEALIGDTNSPRLIRTDLLAFGTTSRGQAHRLGKWKLLSEQTEKETVSFVSGANVIGLKPGDIIAVQDADRDRSSFSGRVSNYNPEAGLTLDSTFDLINGGAIQIGGGNTTTFPGGYAYTASQESDKILFAGEVTLPSSFTQDACLWEHGGEGVGSWLGVRNISGTYNLTLRSGEGSPGTSATSADGIVTNIPISEIPEFDDGVHTICWAFRPDATPGTQKLWIDGKLYINDETSSGGLESGEWSGGGHGGWLRTTDSRSGGLSGNAWPTTAGASGLRHYFGEDAGAGTTGQTTTQVVLDRNVTIPAYSSSFPPQLLLIYPKGGAYLNQDSATISSVAYSKGDLIPAISSSTAAANLVDDSNNAVDVYWSENARIESKTISSPGTSGGTTNTLTLSSAFSAIPSPEVMWSLRIFNSDATEATGTVKEYKIVNIKENENQEYEVVAAEYNINKFDKIERGYSIDPRPNTTFPNPEDEIPAPDNIIVKIIPTEFVEEGGTSGNFFRSHDANITFDFPKNSDGSRYGFVSGFEVTHNFKGKFITERLDTQTQGLTIENVIGGTYEIAVRTISSIETFSLENKRIYTFNELHFTNPSPKGKELSIKKGGLITAPLSFSNSGTFSVGDGTTAFEFTGPDGEVQTLSASATSTMNIANNSGNSAGFSFVLLDLSSNTKTLRQLVEVVDTTSSPSTTYFKLNGASNEGLVTIATNTVIDQYSNKITGTNFTNLTPGQLIKVSNGSSSTTQATGSAASNTTTITLSGTNNNIKVGQTVTGTITGPAGTGTAAGEVSVINISGTTLTVSTPITVGSGVTLTFTPRSFFTRVTEVFSNTIIFVEDIAPRKYSAATLQFADFEPNPLKDAVIAKTFSKNGTFTLSENFTEFAVADNALTLNQISDATIVTESEGIGSNDNDTTFPTSAAVKDYVDNNAAAGTVDTTGTPADNQIAVFTDSDTLEGDNKLTFDGTTLEVVKDGADAVIKVHEDAGTHTARFHLREGTQDTFLQNRSGNGFEIRTEGNISTSNNAAMQINSAGNITAGYNLTVTGNLTVDGTTTTINTADLNVEDKNITLNYHASNDTSSTANGAGITIQDAVDASTDATILWDASNDEFDFSHKITSPSLASAGFITSGGTVTITTNGTSAKQIFFTDSGGGGSSHISHASGIMTLNSNNGTSLGEIVFTRSNSNGAPETARFDASGNFKFGAASTTILDASRNLSNLESISLADSKPLNIGDSNDLKLRHNTNSFIENFTGTLRIINYGDDSDITIETDNGSGGVVEYLRFDGSHTRMTANKNLLFFDNIKADFGTGSDLRIFHDGTDSTITNGNGNLLIQNTADDSHIIFKSDDGSGGTADYLKIDGSASIIESFKDIVFGDSIKAKFGNSSDLQIYHDTSVGSIIEDVGSGALDIRTNGTRAQFSKNGTEFIAKFIPDGAVELYHDNSKKFETTSLGIDVTGQIELGDGHLIGNDSGDNLALVSSSGENIVFGSNNDLYFKTNASSITSTGNTRMFISGANGNVGIGTTSVDEKLHVEGSVNDDDVAIKIQNTFDDNDATSRPSAAVLFSTASNNAYLRAFGAPADTAANHQIDLGSTASGSFITFTPNDTEAMRITSAGNVGIGTSSPSFKLDVQTSSGDSLARFKDSDSSHDGIRIASDVNGGFVGNASGFTSEAIYFQNSINALRFYANAAERLRIDSSGHLDLKTGNYKVNGTTVIDTSRNLHNIANITTTGTGIIGGGLDVGTFTSTGTTSLNLKAEAQHDTTLGFFEDNANHGFSFNYDGGTNQFVLKRHDSSASGASVLTFTRTDNNATFAGDISIPGNLILTGAANEIIKSNGSIRLNIDSDNNQTDRVFIVSTGNNTELFRIDESANVTTSGDIRITGTSGKYQINSLDLIEYSNGFRIGAVADDDEALTLVGFGGQPNIVLGDSAIQFKYSTSEKMRLDSSGRLGIGTQSPNYITHINFTDATTALSGGGSGNWGGNGIRIENNSTTTNTMSLIQFRTHTADWHIGNRFVSTSPDKSDFFFKHENTEVLTILNDGKVGIGTTSPSQALHVVGNGLYTGGLTVGDSAADTFVTKGHTHLATLGNNVGIGTTSPGAPLHITNSDAKIRIQDSDGTNQFGIFGQDGGSAFIRSRNNTSNGTILFQGHNGSATTNYGRWTSGGNFFIGTTDGTTVGTVNKNLVIGSTTNDQEVAVTLNVMEGSNNRRSKFFLDDDDGVYGFDTTASSGVPHFVIRTATTERFRITNSGNVGIGVTSPGNKLDVAGDIKSTTNIISDIFKGATHGTHSFLDFDDDNGNGGSNQVSLVSVGGLNLIADTNANGTDSIFFGHGNTLPGSATKMMELQENGDLDVVGKIGIKTSSPETSLHVAHGSDTSAAVHITGGHTGRRLKIQSFENNSLTGAGFLFNADSSGGALKFQTTSTDRMIIDNSGKVGIGTSAPGANLHVNSGAVRVGSSTFADYKASQIFATGAFNFVSNNNSTFSFANASSVAKVVVDMGTIPKLGIGVSSPTTSLDIVHQISSTGIEYPVKIAGFDAGNTQNQTTASGIGIQFKLAGNVSVPGDSLIGAGIVAMRENASDADSSTGLAFQVSQNDETLDEVMRIDHDGKVGIGTTSPTGILHVNTGSGTGNANTVFLDRTGSTDYSGISFATAGTVDWSIGQNTAGNFEVFEDGLDSQTRFTVEAGGNIGIGTATPSSILHVKATTAQIKINSNDGNSAFLTFGDASDTTRGGLEYTSDDALVFETNNMQERMRIDSSGSVLVGKTTANTGTNGIQLLPNGFTSFTRANDSSMYLVRTGSGGSILEFSIGGGTDSAIGTTGSDDMTFYTGAAATDERMRLTTTGLGIGTTSPQTKLDTSGTIRATGLSTISGGAGTELRYDSSNTFGGVIVFDRSTSSYQELRLEGSAIKLKEAGTDVLTVDGGNATLTGNLIFDDGQITSDGTNFIFDGAGGKEVIISSARDVRIIIDDNNDDTNNEFQIFRHSGSGTKLLNLTQAGALTINEAYTFPTADGSANQVLQTDGSGNLSFAAAGGGTITSASNMSDNRVLTASGSTTINGESNLTFDGSTLTLTGDMTITDTSTDPFIRFNTSEKEYVVRIDNSDADKFQIRDVTAGLTRFSLTSGGNIGIGTASPNQKLEVAGRVRATTDPTFEAYGGSSTNRGGLQWQTANNNLNIFSGGSSSGDEFITFQTNTTEKMRLAADGKLGIGQTNPTAALEVIGDIKIKQGSGYSNYSLIDASEALLTLETYSVNTSAYPADILFKPAGTERMRIADDGNVGIGTSTPDRKLEVENTAGIGEVAISGTTGADLYFRPTTSYSAGGNFGIKVDGGTSAPFLSTMEFSGYNNGVNTIMTLKGDQKVGIGTTSPNHTLDIVGTNGVEITTEETTDAIALLDSNNSNTKYLSIQGDAGDCNINAPAGSLVLQRAGTQRLTVGTTGVAVNGLLSATTKSFIIDHPTKEGMKLRYGSLEGPENGVYARGRLRGNIIELPEYWTELVHEDSITVNLTPIGKHQKLYVEDIKDNQVIVGNENLLGKEINCFYTVYAERKDVEKFEVEYNE